MFLCFLFVKLPRAEPQWYSPQITSSIRPSVSGREFLFIICEFAVKIRSRASRN